MRDPDEGVDEHGCIVTGVRRDRVPGPFAPIIDAAIEASALPPGVRPWSLYLYGSVATGMARSPTSDVDLLAIGMDPHTAGDLSRGLSSAFTDRCRSVEVAAGPLSELDADTDEGYGNRVFLRHYCVHLGGPVLHPGQPAFAGDRRAALGFNGDIDRHARRWRSELEGGTAADEVARRMARKSLFALAGLVSVHDGTWSTDRPSAARRWSEIEPPWAKDLGTLVEWSESSDRAGTLAVADALDGIVSHIVETFGQSVGFWGSG